MSKRIKMLDPAMKYGSALKTIRTDIDVLVQEFFGHVKQAETLKQIILDLCATMKDTETITQGVYTKGIPILHRDNAAMLAIAKGIAIPEYLSPTVDYFALERLLKEACTPEELAECYKPKAASIGKPRRRDD